MIDTDALPESIRCARRTEAGARLVPDAIPVCEGHDSDEQGTVGAPRQGQDADDLAVGDQAGPLPSRRSPQ